MNRTMLYIHDSIFLNIIYAIVGQSCIQKDLETHCYKEASALNRLGNAKV